MRESSSFVLNKCIYVKKHEKLEMTLPSNWLPELKLLAGNIPPYINIVGIVATHLTRNTPANRNVLSSNPSSLFIHQQEYCITNVCLCSSPVLGSGNVNFWLHDLLNIFRRHNVSYNGTRQYRVDGDSLASTELQSVWSVSRPISLAVLVCGYDEFDAIENLPHQPGTKSGYQPQL